METIVHRIRLLPGTDPASFETWVRDVDYAACPQLSSVVAFTVHRAGSDPGAYFEIITVHSRTAFEADTRTEAFQCLVADFDTMATVVDEIAGTRIGSGYHARKEL